MSRKSYVYLNRYKGKYNTIQCTQGKCEVKDYFYITHANCTSSTILDTYRTGCIEQIRHTFNVFRDFVQLDFTENGQQHIVLHYLTNDVNIDEILDNFFINFSIYCVRNRVPFNSLISSILILFL